MRNKAGPNGRRPAKYSHVFYLSRGIHLSYAIILICYNMTLLQNSASALGGLFCQKRRGEVASPTIRAGPLAAVAPPRPYNSLRMTPCHCKASARVNMLLTNTLSSETPLC